MKSQLDSVPRHNRLSRISDDMIDNTPLYNSRLINNYVEYLRVNHPDIDILPLLKYADIESYQLKDEGHWLTQRQVDRFHEMLAEKTNSPNIAREVGRFAVTSRSSGALRQYLLGFISPATAYAVVEKINARLVRSTVLKINSTGPNKIEAIATLMPNVVEKPYQCLNRLGSLETVAKIFTGKYAKIEHPICVHKGGDCCLYNISWEKPPVYLWKHFSYIVGFVACVLSISFLPAAYWDVLVLSFLLAVIGTTLYTEHREKKALIAKIHNQGDAADRLLDQINVSYNNARLIQEIGQATSSILDIKQLLVFIVDALEKRLDFDRGMIMLANRGKTHLLYTIGYGYNPDQREILENVEFHLDNPHSRGVFVVCYRRQIPFVINDIAEITQEISQKSIEFAKRMGTHSFICVPIVFKRESLGILVVDNIRSKRLLGQSDMSLLMGIAPQIAISIHNAVSYRKITESEERFRSLSECAPDIIYTIDSYGTFTYVNPAWHRILGHTSDEVMGKEFINFVREEQTPIYDGLFKKVRIERETIQDVIGTLVHKDGSDRFFSISGAANIDSEGRMIGVVGTLKDLTDIMLSEARLKQSFDKLQSALDSTIQAISKIVESRDPYTSGHQERVARLATAIALEMGLSQDMIASIRMAATLHDVGKINVPAEILSRPRQLNEIEMGMIRMHPEIGYNILVSIEFPYPVARIVLQHHEKMDGSGYPAGLVGESILLEARILVVADVVEAMASHRPYRPSLGLEKTLEEISCYRGVLYDETVVNTCLKLFNEKMFTF